MATPSTAFPAALDTFGGGDFDPSMALAVDAMQPYCAPVSPTAVTVLGSTFPDETCTSNLQIASGTLYLANMLLPAGLTVSNFSVVVSVASSADITHAWMGLFDASYKVVAVSADVTTGGTPAAGHLWTLPVANTVPAAGAATTYTTTRAGLYYFGVMAVVTTTQPTLTACLAVDANGRGAMVPYIAGASTTSSTTPPSVTSVVARTTPSTAGKGILAYVS